METGIYKIFTIKAPLGTYYVQEMPGYWGDGRHFVIMKDRRQFRTKRYDKAKEAIVDLLRILLQNYEAPEIEFPRYKPGSLSNSTNVSEHE